MRGIEEFPITVYIDGVLSPEERKATEEVMSAFPDVAVDFSDVHLFSRGNHMRALRKPIEDGASMVMLLEDDHLVRPDILDVPLNDNSGCFFVSLSFFMEFQAPRYHSKGNVVSAENGLRLLQWIEDRKYVGMMRRNPDVLIDDQVNTSHDTYFDAFLRAENELSQHPCGLYLAHFGLFGTHFLRASADAALLAVEQRMFAGPPERWRDNVAELLHTGDYPTEPEVIQCRLWPRLFNYYGEVATHQIGGV